MSAVRRDGVGQSDIERRLDRVIARVRGVVARRARADERIGDRHAVRERLVVQSGNPGEHDRLRVEDLLAARDGAARPLDVATRVGRARPTH